jgi:hypothetical protein
MVSPTTDRRYGINQGVAIKAPCDLATTANITLSGEQSIDGTTTSASRVFVKNQTTATANGIYRSDTGSWVREPDFNGNRDIVTGTLITVNGGATLADTMWRVTNTGTITIDSTSLTFERAVVNDSASVSFLQAGTGAVTRTAQEKMREWVSAADFTGYDSTGSTDSAAAITAAFAAANEVMIVGTPLIASTITVPTGKKLTFQGGLGNATGAYPPSYIIKKSTMTTNGITINERAWVSGGGLFCQNGNTGDGVALVGNTAKLDNFLVHGAGGVGVRVGTTAGGNFNSFQLDHVTSQYNGSHGFYIHDGKAAEGADANAGTLTQCMAQYNTGDGFHLKHCFWNTLLNCLSEQNTGWGLFISSTVNGAVAESRYHTIIGGDYNEVNTAGVASIGGYACSVYQPDQNQGFTLSGTFVNHFGGSQSTIDTIILGRGQVKFPAVAVPSSDANTLDDYEEGALTTELVVVGTSTAGTASYSLQKGRYTKIGRLVFIEISLTWTGGDGTGNLRINGLPFTSNADTYGCLTVGQASNIALTASNELTAFIDPSSTQVSLSQSVIGGGAASLVAYDAAGTLLLSGFYTV